MGYKHALFRRRNKRKSESPWNLAGCHKIVLGGINLTDKNNKIPFNEDNYTHNINRNNERKLDRRGFMKTLVGAAGVFAVSSLPWGAMAAKELAVLGDKKYTKQKITNI